MPQPSNFPKMPVRSAAASLRNEKELLSDGVRVFLRGKINKPRIIYWQNALDAYTLAPS